MSAALRVVSLNLWKNEGAFPARLNLVIAGLRALAPDVVCLQECFAAADPAIDAAAIVADGIGLWAFSTPARAKARLIGGVLTPSTSGLAILARAPLEVETFALPSDPRDGERIVQRARMADGLGLLNLHLSHLDGDVGARLRGAQLAAALGFAERGGEDLLVCGDFNAPADAAEVALLFSRAELDRGPDPRAAARSTLHGAPEAPAIDHCVLLRGCGAWRVLSVGSALRPQADGMWPSDHAAIVADVAQAGS